jgi:hypothetical protein
MWTSTGLNPTHSFKIYGHVISFCPVCQKCYLSMTETLGLAVLSPRVQTPLDVIAREQKYVFSCMYSPSDCGNLSIGILLFTNRLPRMDKHRVRNLRLQAHPRNDGILAVRSSKWKPLIPREPLHGGVAWCVNSGGVQHLPYC